MVTVRRTTLLALLVGAALLTAMLMFGSGQSATPDAASAATAQSTKTVAKKATKAKSKAHSKKLRHRSAKAKRIAATTTTDAPGAETGAPEIESSTEPPGEPADGYEDPAGQDVQHECPPACGPGEQG
jgi:hypothetical protein